MGNLHPVAPSQSAGSGHAVRQFRNAGDLPCLLEGARRREVKEDEPASVQIANGRNKPSPGEQDRSNTQQKQQHQRLRGKPKVVLDAEVVDAHSRHEGVPPNQHPHRLPILGRSQTDSSTDRKRNNSALAYRLRSIRHQALSPPPTTTLPVEDGSHSSPEITPELSQENRTSLSRGSSDLLSFGEGGDGASSDRIVEHGDTTWGKHVRRQQKRRVVIGRDLDDMFARPAPSLDSIMIRPTQTSAIDIGIDHHRAYLYHHQRRASTTLNSRLEVSRSQRGGRGGRRRKSRTAKGMRKAAKREMTSRASYREGQPHPCTSNARRVQYSARSFSADAPVSATMKHDSNKQRSSCSKNKRKTAGSQSGGVPQPPPISISTSCDKSSSRHRVVAVSPAVLSRTSNGNPAVPPSPTKFVGLDMRLLKDAFAFANKEAMKEREKEERYKRPSWDHQWKPCGAGSPPLLIPSDRGKAGSVYRRAKTAGSSAVNMETPGVGNSNGMEDWVRGLPVSFSRRSGSTLPSRQNKKRRSQHHQQRHNLRLHQEERHRQIYGAAVAPAASNGKRCCISRRFTMKAKVHGGVASTNQTASLSSPSSGSSTDPRTHSDASDHGREGRGFAWGRRREINETTRPNDRSPRRRDDRERGPRANTKGKPLTRVELVGRFESGAASMRKSAQALGLAVTYRRRGR